MSPLSALADDLLAFGAAALPTEALLRLLLGPEARDEELHRLSEALALAPQARLEALRAAEHGPALLAALELGRRALLWPPPTRVPIRSPSDVAAVAAARVPDGAESLLVLALDERLGLARAFFAAHGSPDEVKARPSDVLGPVLSAGCRRFVLCHRHLSGDPTPSGVDKRATLRLFERGRELGAALLDHVVLGDGGHVSMLRAGLLSPLDRRYG